MEIFMSQSGCFLRAFELQITAKKRIFRKKIILDKIEEVRNPKIGQNGPKNAKNGNSDTLKFPNPGFAG